MILICFSNLALCQWQRASPIWVLWLSSEVSKISPTYDTTEHIIEECPLHQCPHGTSVLKQCCPADNWLNNLSISTIRKLRDPINLFPSIIAFVKKNVYWKIRYSRGALTQIYFPLSSRNCNNSVEIQYLPNQSNGYTPPIYYNFCTTLCNPFRYLYIPWFN